MNEILDKLRVAIANDTSGELRERIAAGCRMLLAMVEQAPSAGPTLADSAPDPAPPPPGPPGSSADPATAAPSDQLGALFDRLIAKYEPMLPEKRPLAPIFPLRFVPLSR
jgi:hypothetical protein